MTALTVELCSIVSEFPVVMPGVTPKLPNNESYLCTGVTVADSTLFITGIYKGSYLCTGVTLADSTLFITDI